MKFTVSSQPLAFLNQASTVAFVMDQQPHTGNKWVLSEETIIVWLWCHDLGDV